MSRKLGTIQRISCINEIEGAEKIEHASILGWKSVVEKNKYKVNDLIVFVEIDSILPERPEFEFLRKDKFRIRTIKLRGAISQGIVFPLDILNANTLWHICELEKSGLILHDQADSPEGMDVSEELGISKYDPPIPAELSGNAKGARPSFFPITDEDRIQILPHIPIEYSGQSFIATEKLDGCLDGGTLIETEDGIKTIKEICETKYVGKIKTFDFIKNEIVFENIINHFICENKKQIKTRLINSESPKKWFKIILENSMVILLTENHEIWLPNLSCWRRADELIGNEDFLFDE